MSDASESAARVQESAHGDPAAASMDELSDDVLHLLRLVRELSDGQKAQHGQIESSISELRDVLRQHATELHNLRRDLLDQRRAQASRSAFDAVHPAIDQIELVHASLPDRESDSARHISAVLSALRMVLRGLGFAPFSVDVGDPFDPARMECVEYAEGEQGVVLAVLRPGYRTDDVVVRRCGVAIADPAAAASTTEDPQQPEAAEHETETEPRAEIEDDE